MKHIYLETVSKAFISYLDEMFAPFKDTLSTKTFPISIMNTGDEVYLTNMMKKGKGDAVYSYVPRMNIDIGGIDLSIDEMTSNKMHGSYVSETDGFKSSKRAKVRRMPMTIAYSTEVKFNHVFEYFTFVEIMLTTAANNHSFSFYYLGKSYNAVFSIQESTEASANLELGFDSDRRLRKLPVVFNISCQYPAFDIYSLGNNQGSEMDENTRMEKLIHNMHVNDESPAGIISTMEITKTT